MCTNCHNMHHELKVRTRRWDKASRKLDWFDGVRTTHSATNKSTSTACSPACCSRAWDKGDQHRRMTGVLAGLGVVRCALTGGLWTGQAG